MNKAEAEKIEKAAKAACFDAMFEVHRQARKYNTTVVCEIDGVTIEKQPLSDEELARRQSRIRKLNKKR
ncbi:hypothetical protein [uncultured Alteromonas sp.]|uniref:hypothetical protein n=1 Tax=uncultured Alteromonas sp. TaxID=179113 RepID=UPI0030D806C7